MKKSIKSILALLLTAALLFTAFPITVAADSPKTMTVTVETKNAMAGTTVNLDVIISDNPGVAAMSLDIDYDKTNLMLTGFTYNDEALAGASTTPYNANASTPCLYVVNGSQNITGDFTLATLTFEVKENAKNNTAAYVKLTYDPDNIYDITESNIECNVVNGAINIIACVPGDINGDEKVNSKDVSRLMQYHAHWDVDVNEPALDVNGDGKLNSKDVTRLMQYLAHWDVKLYPQIDSVANLIAIPAVAPGCETEGNIAYWKSEETGKYYRDEKGLIEISLDDTVIAATGHTVVIDPAVPATYEHTGLTEGAHCSVCGKVLKKQKKVPVLEADAYNITYHLYADDAYLQSAGVTNPNPSTYTSQQGLKLQNVRAEGYIFEGWYDGEGANGELVKNIPVGTEGDIELYAKWTAREYTITFNSPLVPVASKKYKVNTGATLSTPSLNGYNFIGWCDENDKLVTQIPVGTTGNITLYANWTSRRNQTRPVSRLEEPLIIEDAEKGTIMFAYEIGTIENVPLQALSPTYQSIGGMKQTYTTSETATVTKSEAKNIAKTVSNSTSDSKAWTLSDNWNDVTSVSESYAAQKGWTKEEAEQQSKTSSNTYSLNSSTGGAQTQTASNGLSGTLSRSNSSTSGGSITTERETGSEFEISDKASMGVEVSAKYAGVGAKVSAGYEVSQSEKNYEKNKESQTLNYSSTGTDSSSITGQTSTANTGTSSWNTSSGYSSSSSVSQTQSVRNVLSEVVSETKGYGSSYSKGGSKSDTQSFTNTSAESNQYSSAITFSEGTTRTETKTIELGGENEGYYRFVLAGIAHVFAVVGYDVSTGSYFVFNYTVMDNDTYTFIDYSASTASFNDNENGVLPFEVPYFVKEYVDARIIQTEGLSVSQEGVVTNFTGTDDIIFVPAYYKMDNRDGTYTSIKITGIDKNAFAGKNIKAIYLSNFITEIPSGAFNNCSSLEAVICPGVTKIQSYAFKGCTSLREFKVPSTIETLGTRAFEGLERLSVDASSREVANGAIESGAKNLVLTISANPTALNGAEIIVPSSIESFELRGNAENYKNLKVKSDATTTVINGLNITYTNGTPLEISSEDVIFNRVNIESTGYAALLKNAETNIGLYGSVKMNSANGKAIVCRNINLSEVDSSISSSLSVTGNVLLCGKIEGQKYLSITNGSIIQISDEDFEKYAKGCYEVKFNANGGTASLDKMTVYYGSKYGTLPTASRDFYSFNGWFTQSSGGSKVTEDTIFEGTSDSVLYAQWTDHPTSGWVLASQLPAGAKVVDTKWTYDLTSYTTSSSSSLSGWTQYDSSWVWSDYGSWSSWSKTQYSSSDSRKVEEKTVTDQAAYTSYKYWIYRTPNGNGWGTKGFSTSQGTCSVYDEINITYALGVTDSANGCYGYYQSPNFSSKYANQWFSGGSTWHAAVTHKEWRYADRSKVYTYYYKRTDGKEATYDPSGESNVSNVQKWVKYIAK